MKDNDLKQKEELCSSLAMNFDEASELFEAETLGSMKMARVNGGNPVTLAGALLSFGISIAAGVATYYLLEWLNGTDAKSSEVSGDTFGFNVKDNGLYFGTDRIDSVKVKDTANGSYYQIWTNTTDTPSGTDY